MTPLRGGTYTIEAKKAFLASGAPEYDVARLAVNRWMVRKQLSAKAGAALLGIGESTLNQWTQGAYPRFHTDSNVAVLTGKIWLAMQRHPAPAPQPPPERFLETRNGAVIRRLLNACDRQHACAVVHGAPAKEKTFTVRCLLAEQEAAGREHFLYIYPLPDSSPLGLLQLLCAAAGVAVRSNMKVPLMQALIDNFRQRERMPVVVVDEAQHLMNRPYHALDTLRRLRDLTADDLAARRQDSYGCGLLLIGSHDLYQRFERDKLLVAQWRDRIQHKAQLTGMDESEALSIAARELGNGRPARLGPELQQKLLEYSREADPLCPVCAKCGRGLALEAEVCDSCGGRPRACVYYSPRKLSIWIDRSREKRVAQRGAA